MCVSLLNSDESIMYGLYKCIKKSFVEELL